MVTGVTGVGFGTSDIGLPDVVGMNGVDTTYVVFLMPQVKELP